MKAKTVFFGGSDFSVWVLDKLYTSKKLDFIAVITNPDAIVGRKREIEENVVKKYAKSKGIPVYEKPADLKKIFDVELAITASYGHIIKQELLDIPKYGFLNVHGSLLPELRGAIPIQKAIYTSLACTGVTVIQMDAGMDTGAILGQQEVGIEDRDTFKTLGKKIAVAGVDILLAKLDDYLTGVEVLRVQDNTKATSCFLSDLPEMKHISSAMSAIDIDRAVRAFAPYEALSLPIGKTEILLIEVYPAESVEQHVQGEVFKLGKQVYVQCKEGQLALVRIKPKGKKEMTGIDFWNGYKR